MPLSRLSIKHLLFLIVVIIAFPAICIIVNSGVKQRRIAVNNAKVATRELAETIVSEQKSIIASAQQLFIALSQLPEVKNHNSVEVEAILSEILRLSPQYSNIFIADLSGHVWASGDPSDAPVSVAERRFFKNALASGRFSSGEYNAAKNPTLNLGYPLKDAAGKITAVISVDLSLDRYRHIFEAYNLPKGASFSLFDHRGIILARAIEPEKYVGKEINPEIFQYMLAGPEEETSIGTSSVIGDNRIQTYRKLSLEGESTPYMYIRAGIPTGLIMAKSNGQLINDLLIYSVSVITAFFLSWIIGKKFIIDRIIVLQRSSQRLADGDLKTRIAQEVAGGEIGELGKSFDDMAIKLASREQALIESEKKYREIFNTTHDAFIINDELGWITDANRASEIMFGYSREELLPMSIGDLISGQPPYSFPEALMLMERSIKEGTQKFEWMNKRKNGQSFWTEIEITPTYVVGERRILAVIRDITERKDMENIKEAMLSTISHEMRTPLTAMLGFLEYVIDNNVEKTQLNHYHQIMYKEGAKLNDMVSNLLDLQRLKSKLLDVNLTYINISELIEEVVEIFSNPSAKHLITVNSLVDLPPIMGDNELLNQALRNLVSNAIKYSPDDSHITIGADLKDNLVNIWVKDEGIGIQSEYLDSIFNMFYRVEGASKRQTGTGLGLALVKEIAEAHNGRVWVESTVGEGSTFYVSLPVVREDLLAG